MPCLSEGAGGGRRRQVLLPSPWQCDQVDQIRDAKELGFTRSSRRASSPTSVSLECPTLGKGSRARPGVLARADRCLPRAQADQREIKPLTWHRLYRHHMKHVLGAMAMPTPPQNAKQLVKALARIWADKPGGRTRQIQIQSTAALLRWGVAVRRLGEDWEPPQDLAGVCGVACS